MKKAGPGIAALLALALLGAFVVHQLGDAATDAEVGDCARITGSPDNPQYQAVDCSSDQASVKIAKVLGWNESECPSGGMDYSTFTAGATLCLMPNFKQGSCYGHDPRTGIAEVDCGHEGAVRVAGVLTGSTDGAACRTGRAAIFPEPAVTFCLQRGTE